jgi:hypothetical protein
VIKHYEMAVADNDEMDAQLQSEIRTKVSFKCPREARNSSPLLQLQNTLDVLQAKSMALQEDIKREEEIIGGALFDTDQPEHNQHKVSSTLSGCHEPFHTSVSSR